MKHLIKIKDFYLCENNTYKDYTPRPQIGNYIKSKKECKNLNSFYCNFANNNIGKVVEVGRADYKVYYENMPHDICQKLTLGNEKIIIINIWEVDSYGTKEEMEIKLNVNKYNL